MKCIILGSGGSNGVPQIGCGCYVCKSDNAKNKRTRVSIYVETKSAKILVDTSPDLRTQALENNISHLDAILFTHMHSDHTSGINDAKLLNEGLIDAYMDEATWKHLDSAYGYLFKQANPLYPPRLRKNIIKSNSEIEVKGNTIQVFSQNHGMMESLGFRFNDLVYSTDVKEIPEESFEYLQGVKVWILDCQRYHKVPSHGYLDKIMDWAARVKPETIILTHMSHGIEYEEFKKLLPKNIIPGYDGMVINM